MRRTLLAAAGILVVLAIASLAFFLPGKETADYHTARKLVVLDLSKPGQRTASVEQAFSLGPSELGGAGGLALLSGIRLEQISTYPGPTGKTAAGEVSCMAEIRINGQLWDRSGHGMSISSSQGKEWGLDHDEASVISSWESFPPLTKAEKAYDLLDLDGDNMFRLTLECTVRVTQAGPTVVHVTLDPFTALVS